MISQLNQLEDHLWRKSTISEWIFRKIRVLTIYQKNLEISVESQITRNFCEKSGREL